MHDRARRARIRRAKRSRVHHRCAFIPRRGAASAGSVSVAVTAAPARTISQHTFGSVARYESSGKVFFGLPSDWGFYYL